MTDIEGISSLHLQLPCNDNQTESLGIQGIPDLFIIGCFSSASIRRVTNCVLPRDAPRPRFSPLVTPSLFPIRSDLGYTYLSPLISPKNVKGRGGHLMHHIILTVTSQP